MKTLAGIAYDVNNYGKSVLKKLLNQLFKLWKIWNIPAKITDDYR